MNHYIAHSSTETLSCCKRFGVAMRASQGKSHVALAPAFRADADFCIATALVCYSLYAYSPLNTLLFIKRSR